MTLPFPVVTAPLVDQRSHPVAARVGGSRDALRATPVLSSASSSSWCSALSSRSLPPISHPSIRPRPMSARGSRLPTRCTGSASTCTAAICSRVSSGAGAIRSRSAWRRSCWRSSSAARSASSWAIAAVGSTPSGSRAIDVLLGFPSVVMAILVVAVLGVGLVNVVIAVAIAQVPRFARVVRGAVLVTKEQLYVDAARAIGASGLQIMARHLLPNVMPTLIVLGTLNLGEAILSTATLSFLGLGAQPPTPEWGAMLNDGRDYMRYAPWMMFFPGLALFLAVMSVNLIGDRLSHLLDPRARNR